MTNLQNTQRTDCNNGECVQITTSCIDGDCTERRVVVPPGSTSSSGISSGNQDTQRGRRESYPSNRGDIDEDDSSSSDSDSSDSECGDYKDKTIAIIFSGIDVTIPSTLYL